MQTKDETWRHLKKVLQSFERPKHPGFEVFKRRYKADALALVDSKKRTKGKRKSEWARPSQVLVAVKVAKRNGSQALLPPRETPSIPRPLPPVY